MKKPYKGPGINSRWYWLRFVHSAYKQVFRKGYMKAYDYGYCLDSVVEFDRD